MTGLQTSIDAFDLNDLWKWGELIWWIRILICVGIFACIVILAFIAKASIAQKGIKKEVNDNVVIIQKQDIFATTGLKVIPFNEFYDTLVDDNVIAHSSLNGIFIDKYVDDIEDLRRCIAESDSQSSSLKPHIKNGRNCYPLGKIIKYDNEYLLLSFTHFANNEAHLSHNDFEKCLFNMWKEIERVYANRPIAIPLLGSGITRFDDTPHKTHNSLISCILCTLKTSNVHIKQPITLCLTEDVFDELNIYELK